MPASIIDGRAVADRIRAQISTDVAAFIAKYGYAPRLGALLVGDYAPSETYVRMKERAAGRVGIETDVIRLSKESTQADVVGAVQQLNEDPRVHGILVQLPLPDHIDEEAVLRRVSLGKDADGLHPANIGLLAMKGRDPLFTPATPTGCMVLLKEAGAQLSGANVVVVGRSNIVGMPMALLLIKANATVTIAHSRTQDLPGLLKQADVVIAAIGKAHFIQGEWLKPGAIVIDVGTNRVDDANSERGYRLVGDVDFESAVEVAGAITKVPGGVGPMTITTLLQNTLKAAQHLAENA